MKHFKPILFVLIALLLALPCAAQQVRQPESISVTILAGASVSSVANLAGCTPAALLMPTTAVGWTSASVGFEATIDGTNYFKVYDQYGTRISITAAANQWVTFSPADTWSFFSVKLASIDTSGNAANQAAERTIKIICRK